MGFQDDGLPSLDQHAVGNQDQPKYIITVFEYLYLIENDSCVFTF